MTESSNQKQKLIDKVVIHVKSDPNDTGIQANNKFNIEYIKGQVANIAGYSGNTFEYPPDGTIVITPHYMGNLPNEIVDVILFHVHYKRQSKQLLQNDLYQCSLINKQFYQQANRLLWHTPVISNADSLDRFLTCLTNTQILQQGTTRSGSFTMKNTKSRHYTVPSHILTAKNHIRRLDIKDNSGWNDLRFSLMMPSLGLLETLTIDDKAKSNITDASLQYLPRHCPYLTTLVFVPTVSFTNQFIHSYLQNCHHLRQIELYLSFNDLHEHIFKSLLNCPSLISLILQSQHLDMGGNQSFSTSMVMDIMALTQLTGLVLIGHGKLSTLHTAFNIIQRDSINTNPWPLLSCLRIDCGGGIFLDDTVMIPFIESHPRLKFLHLYGTSVSDSTLNKIGTHLPRLTRLSLGGNSYITTNGVYNLVRGCHYLKQADFPDCLRLQGSMVAYPTLTIADMDMVRQRGDND